MLHLPAVLAHGGIPVVPGTPSWGNVLHPLVVLVLALFVVTTNHRPLVVGRPSLISKIKMPPADESTFRLLLAALTIGVVVLMFSAAKSDPFDTSTQLVQLFWYALTLISIFSTGAWSNCAPWLVGSRWLSSENSNIRPVVGSVLLLALNVGFIAYLTTNAKHWLGLTVALYVVIMVAVRFLKGPAFAYSIDPLATYSSLLRRRLVSFAAAVVVFATSAYRVLSDHTGWLTWSSSTSEFVTFAKRSLTLLAIVAVVATVCAVGGLIVSYCSGASFKIACNWFVRSLVPLAIATFFAHDLYPFAIKVQEQAAVLYDPLGRGWSSRSGIQLNLAKSYLGVIEVAALLLGPVAAAWTTQRQLATLPKQQATFAAMPIYLVIAVLGYMMAKVLVPF